MHPRDDEEQRYSTEASRYPRPAEVAREAQAMLKATILVAPKSEEEPIRLEAKETRENVGAHRVTPFP